jgi:hypothetical protein
MSVRMADQKDRDIDGSSDAGCRPAAAAYFFRVNLKTPGFELPELVHRSS